MYHSSFPSLEVLPFDTLSSVSVAHDPIRL